MSDLTYSTEDFNQRRYRLCLPREVVADLMVQYADEEWRRTHKTGIGDPEDPDTIRLFLRDEGRSVILEYANTWPKKSGKGTGKA